MEGYDENELNVADASQPTTVVGCFAAMMTVLNKILCRDTSSYIVRLTKVVNPIFDVIEQDGVPREGIYRISGRQSAHRKLTRRLNRAVRRGRGLNNRNLLYTTFWWTTRS